MNAVVMEDLDLIEERRREERKRELESVRTSLHLFDEEGNEFWLRDTDDSLMRDYATCGLRFDDEAAVSYIYNCHTELDFTTAFNSWDVKLGHRYVFLTSVPGMRDHWVDMDEILPIFKRFDK